MFDKLIATDHRLARLGLGPSGAVAVLAHAALIAAVWGTVQPGAIANPRGFDVLIPWPDATTSTAAAPRAPSSGMPRAPSFETPGDVPVGLPPIDPRVSLDLVTWVRETGRVVGAAAPRIDPGEPWSLASVEQGPALLAGPLPSYPEPLRRAGIAGRVVVEGVVDTLGRAEPGSIVIVASPDRRFDASARDYLLRALFRPARAHGRAVRVLVRLPVDFTLTRAPAP